ncbi:MAG: hypothetical protein N2V75_10250 [Methanophagales archaeon]|nr:hypothetical protein [Methanophagales archaeon]
MKDEKVFWVFTSTISKIKMSALIRKEIIISVKSIKIKRAIVCIFGNYTPHVIG